MACRFDSGYRHHRQTLAVSRVWRFFYGNRRPFSAASADASQTSGSLLPGNPKARKPCPAWADGFSEVTEVIFRIGERTSLIPRPEECPGWPGRSSPWSCSSSGCRCCWWCRCRCDRARPGCPSGPRRWRTTGRRRFSPLCLRSGVSVGMFGPG